MTDVMGGIGVAGEYVYVVFGHAETNHLNVNIFKLSKDTLQVINHINVQAPSSQGYPIKRGYILTPTSAIGTTYVTVPQLPPDATVYTDLLSIDPDTGNITYLYSCLKSEVTLQYPLERFCNSLRAQTDAVTGEIWELDFRGPSFRPSSVITVKGNWIVYFDTIGYVSNEAVMRMLDGTTKIYILSESGYPNQQELPINFPIPNYYAQ